MEKEGLYEEHPAVIEAARIITTHRFRNPIEKIRDRVVESELVRSGLEVAVYAQEVLKLNVKSASMVVPYAVTVGGIVLLSSFLKTEGVSENLRTVSIVLPSVMAGLGVMVALPRK